MLFVDAAAAHRVSIKSSQKHILHVCLVHGSVHGSVQVCVCLCAYVCVCVFQVMWSRLRYVWYNGEGKREGEGK